MIYEFCFNFIAIFGGLDKGNLKYQAFYHMDL